MIVCIIPTKIHGRWARWVNTTSCDAEQTFFQMRKEDIVQLYHFTPRGITITESSMKYKGIPVTTSCVIEVTDKDFIFRKETPEEFLERTKGCSADDKVSTDDSLHSNTSVQTD
jgi:hypothetical protein